ncbi:MAG: Cys-Cys-COOH (seleno)protein SaoC [Desulfosporosinus sp.]|jgi:hypothetical protein
MLRKNSLALLLLSLLLLTLLCLTSCSGGERQGEETLITIDTEHVLYAHFLAAFGDKKPLLTGVNDLNNDGREDLVVIYQDTTVTNKMIAIWEEGGRTVISEPTPAPVENYRIEWRNIDDQDPIELIISGSKGVNIGYAIYRWQKGELVNLFGEGMEDCC